MRPEMDEYDDLEEGERAGKSRAVSWMILAVVVSGFAGLAYYAYHSGKHNADNSELMVVEADETPIKAAPESPEGEQFVNKDKTIYDAISSEGDKTVEKLLPEAENPITAANHGDGEADSAVPEAAVAAAPVAPKPTAVVKQEQPVAAEAAPVVQAPVVVKAPEVAAPVVKATPVVAAAKMEEKSYAAPQMINEKPTLVHEQPVAAVPAAPVKPAQPVVSVKAEKPAVKKAETKPAVKPTPTPAKETPVKAAAGGTYMLQLGAYKSEEEAQTAWKKISAAHGAAIGAGHAIVKADLPNGTFYRLRAGSFASADAAKAACAKLGGQACFPVK